MRYVDLFDEIRRALSSVESVSESAGHTAGESALVFAALRQDPLVWQSLGQADSLQVALEHLGSQAQNWSPARLALLAVSAVAAGCPAEVLCAEPLQAPAQALQERAL